MHRGRHGRGETHPRRSKTSWVHCVRVLSREVWADAARAWMGLRAKWGDRATGDVRALGENAVRRWGASLAGEGEA